MIGSAWEMHYIAIPGEDVSGSIIAASHPGERGGILCGNCAELRAASIRSARGDRRNYYVMNHPSLVPARFIVDDEQPGDIGEHIDECARVIGIGRQAGLGLKDHTHSANRRQIMIGSGGSRRDAVINARNCCSEDIGFEMCCIEKVVLKELTWVV